MKRYSNCIETITHCLLGSGNIELLTFAIQKKILNKSENIKIYLMSTKIFHSRHTPRSMTSNTFDEYNLLAFKIYYELFSTRVEASTCLRLIFFLISRNSFN